MNSKKAQRNVIKEAHTTMDIDFVITWVNMNDPKWQAEKIAADLSAAAVETPVRFWIVQ